VRLALLGGWSVPAANAGAKAALMVGGMLAGFPGAGPVGEQLLGAAEVGGSRATGSCRSLCWPG
jgi:hypothetical protein